MNLQELEKTFKEHKHGGKNTQEIPSSNVKINTNNLENLKTFNLDSILNEIDKTISNKQDRLLPGSEDSFITIKKDGKIKLESLKSYASNGHTHKEYLSKLKDGTPYSILAKDKNGEILVTDLDINDVMNRKLVNDLNMKINNLNLVVTSLKQSLSNKSSKDHAHKEYLHKAKGTKNNIVIFSDNGISDSDVGINDIVTTKMLNESIKNLVSRISKIEDTLNKKADIEHTHKINSIDNFDLRKFINKEISKMIPNIVSDLKDKIKEKIDEL